MVMNMSANMLGLGNAATPLGLRAMRDLETLNPRPGVATNAMCTFLAINTSSVQLIPATAIAILAASGSTRPTAIVGTALLATLCAASVAIISVKLLEKLSIFQPSGPTPVMSDDSRYRSVPQSTTELPEETPVAELPPHRVSIYGSIALGILTVLFSRARRSDGRAKLVGLTVAPDTAAQNFCSLRECHVDPGNSVSPQFFSSLCCHARGESLRRVCRGRERRLWRDSEDHSLSGDYAGGDRNV
jgi:hypothetical protein